MPLLMAPTKHLKTTFYLSALSASFWLAACGGGGGGGNNNAATDAGPGLQVTATSPADGAVDVELDAVLSAEFNKDIFAKSATDDASAIVLSKTGSSNALVKTVTADTSKSVTITPGAPFTMLTSYTVTATDSVTDLSGTALANEQSWSFTTKDGTWSDTATPIGARATPIGATKFEKHEFAISKSGHGIAVWLKEEGSPAVNQVFASYYSATSNSWSTPEQVSNSATLNITALDVAIDHDGNAMAVWYRRNGSPQKALVSARFRPAGSSSSWQAAEEIYQGDVNNGLRPRVEFDANGNAMAIWSTADDSIAYSQYTSNTSSWSTAADAFSIDGTSTSYFHPDLAVDSAGNAIVLWLKDEPSEPNRDNRLFANRYNAATQSWGSKTAIENRLTGGSAFYLNITFDGQGNAFAAWDRTQVSGGRHPINAYVSRFDKNSNSWTNPSHLKSPRQDECGKIPAIAANNNGNAVVVFGCGEAYSSYYQLEDNSWSSVEEIGNYNAQYASVTIDDNGNVLAAWVKSDTGNPANNIHANRYAANEGGWQGEQLISIQANGKADKPIVATDAIGRAIVVWEDDGQIFSNRFAAD